MQEQVTVNRDFAVSTLRKGSNESVNKKILLVEGFKGKQDEICCDF